MSRMCGQCTLFVLLRQARVQCGASCASISRTPGKRRFGQYLKSSRNASAVTVRPHSATMPAANVSGVHRPDSNVLTQVEAVSQRCHTSSWGRGLPSRRCKAATPSTSTSTPPRSNRMTQDACGAMPVSSHVICKVRYSYVVLHAVVRVVIVVCLDKRTPGALVQNISYIHAISVRILS